MRLFDRATRIVRVLSVTALVVLIGLTAGALRAAAQPGKLADLVVLDKD